MYKDLLLPNRLRDSSRGEKSLTEEVESDRARVLYSASFRRLQRKTQVFPLEDNASVRTRLTHSLEVAHVGRYLATSIIREADSQGKRNEMGLTSDLEHAFAVTVEVACLLHDIGNPPFGHFGEFAISEWFRNKEGTTLPDMEGFDGNPQGFRIISRLAGADGRHGMNLTLSQLASTIKYSSLPRERTKFKKFGVFETEAEVLQKLREQFELKPEQRFPLAYIMEAADDISYCLSDIEDGVEKKVVRYTEIIEELKREARDSSEALKIINSAADYAQKSKNVDEIVSFRSYLVNHLVQAAAKSYVNNHPSILSGGLMELVTEDSPEGKLLRHIKGVVRKLVYSDSSIQSLELAGFSVIRGLLDKFGKLLTLDRKDFKKLIDREKKISYLDVEKRLIDFIAPSHLRVYEVAVGGGVDDAFEMLLRAHLVVDYISGMTDPFALTSHQKLSGIRL